MASFPLLPCFLEPRSGTQSCELLYVVFYKFQIPALTYHYPSNTVIFLTHFVFTMMGRGNLAFILINIIRFGRTIESNEPK